MKIWKWKRGGGNVYTDFILNSGTETILQIIEEKVIPGSIVYTDTLRAYNVLDVSDSDHKENQPFIAQCKSTEPYRRDREFFQVLEYN